MEQEGKPGRPSPCDNAVGDNIRVLRLKRHLSLREVAAQSTLSINTLSLIENGKSSPSVSTLQLLARALEVPITAFFESEPAQKRVVYTHHERRPQADIAATRMENLGKDLAGNAVQPFEVTLEPGSGSGPPMIVHSGHEFAYCLSGTITYCIDEIDYPLGPGDSLVFEAHLPHRWENTGEGEAKMVLVLIPADRRDETGGTHFQLE